LILPLALGSELHDAVRVCDLARVKSLLNSNPHLNEKDSQTGRTPLLEAVVAAKPACVAMLLRAGSDKLAVDTAGRSALDLADDIKDPNAREKVVYSILAPDWPWYGQSTGQDQPHGPMPWSLEYAALRGQQEVVSMLLRLRADPNAVGTDGNTPLHDACLKGNLPVARLLLDHGAKLTVRSAGGTLPLHDAALGGSADVIRELVARGADVRVTTPEGQTPLHIAAAWGKLDAVRELLKSGAPRDVKDAKDRTPLEAALAAGQQEAAALLR